MATNPYLPGLEPINTMNNPVWNPITQTFEYGKSAKASQPGLPGWDIYDKPGLPSGYPGTSGSLNKRYVSVPEGMLETMSDAVYDTERRGIGEDTSDLSGIAATSVWGNPRYDTTAPSRS